MSSLRRKLISAMACAYLCSPASSAHGVENKALPSPKSLGLSTGVKVGLGCSLAAFGLVGWLTYLGVRKDDKSDVVKNSEMFGSTTVMKSSNRTKNFHKPVAVKLNVNSIPAPVAILPISKFDATVANKITELIGNENFNYLCEVCKKLGGIRSGGFEICDDKILSCVKSIKFIYKFRDREEFSGKFTDSQISNFIKDKKYYDIFVKNLGGLKFLISGIICADDKLSTSGPGKFRYDVETELWQNERITTEYYSIKVDTAGHCIEFLHKEATFTYELVVTLKD